jgi:hypothetical protein
MPGKKISSLTRPTAKNDLQVAATDSIPLARGSTTLRLPGASFIYSLSSVGRGTSIVGTRDNDPTTQNTLSVKSLSANPPILLTDNGDNISYDLPYDNTLIFKDGKLGVNISTGGGVELGTGGIKLTPPGSPAAAVIAVRPSATLANSALGSDDNVSLIRNTVTTGNDRGTLQPYFKTLNSAISYANSNFSGTFTVYIDEDIVEGTKFTSLTNSGGTTYKFITDSDLAAKGTTWSSSLDAGVFVWNRYSNLANSQFVGSPSSFVGGSSTVDGTGRFFARYYRSDTATWTTSRYFNEAPKKITINIFYDKSGALTPGDLGSNPNNWTSFCANDYPNSRTGYLPNRPIYFNNVLGTHLVNLHFDLTTNANDSTALYVGRGSNTIQNCTVTLNGNGFWRWGYFYGDFGGTTTVNGSLLQDPTTTNSNGVFSYPGYGLACIGSSSSTTPTNVSRFFNSQSAGGEILRIYDHSNYAYSSFPGGGLKSAIILDGNINIQSGFITQASKSMLGCSNIFLSGSTLKLTTSGINLDNTTNTHPRTTIPANITTFNPSRGCQLSMPADGAVAEWTYHKLLSPVNPQAVTPTKVYGLPAWYTLPAGGNNVPGGTFAGGVITYDVNISERAVYDFNSYPLQIASSKSTLTGKIDSISQINASTALYPYTLFYTLTNTTNQTHTLVYK